MNRKQNAMDEAGEQELAAAGHMLTRLDRLSERLNVAVMAVVEAKRHVERGAYAVAAAEAMEAALDVASPALPALAVWATQAEQCRAMRVGAEQIGEAIEAHAAAQGDLKRAEAIRVGARIASDHAAKAA